MQGNGRHHERSRSSRDGAGHNRLRAFMPAAARADQKVSRATAVLAARGQHLTDLERAKLELLAIHERPQPQGSRVGLPPFKLNWPWLAGAFAAGVVFSLWPRKMVVRVGSIAAGVALRRLKDHLSPP